MINNNTFNDQNLNGEFPEPDVPVNEAWKDMELRLHATLPKQSIGKRFGANKLITGILIIVILCIAVLLVIRKNPLPIKKESTSIHSISARQNSTVIAKNKNDSSSNTIITTIQKNSGENDLSKVIKVKNNTGFNNNNTSTSNKNNTATQKNVKENDLRKDNTVNNSTTFNKNKASTLNKNNTATQKNVEENDLSEDITIINNNAYDNNKPSNENYNNTTPQLNTIVHTKNKQSKIHFSSANKNVIVLKNKVVNKNKLYYLSKDKSILSQKNILINDSTTVFNTANRIFENNNYTNKSDNNLAQIKSHFAQQKNNKSTLTNNSDNIKGNDFYTTKNKKNIHTNINMVSEGLQNETVTTNNSLFATRLLNKFSNKITLADNIYALNIKDSILKRNPILIQNKSKTAIPKNKNKSGNTLSIHNKLFKKIGYGLQWNVPLPLQNNGQYFTGSNTTNQSYLLLIPTVWVSKKFKKSEIMFQVIPYQQTFTGSNVVDTNRPPNRPPVPPGQDSTLFSTTLFKTFGFGFGLQYNFNITPSFIVGVGLNYTIQQTALQKNTEQDRSGHIIQDSLYSINKSTPHWNYNPSFITSKIELAYKRNKYDVGVDLQIPLTNLSSDPKNNIKPVNGQLFFRWKIR